MKKKKRSLVRQTAFLALLIAVIAFSTAYFCFPALLFKSSGGSGWSDASATESITPNRVNILLLGFDRDAGRESVYSIFRPDTIMIASLDLKERSVSLVSIPRDSYVKIAGTEIYDKINHSYMYGYNMAGVTDKHQSGVNTVIRTVEEFLGGIPVNCHVIVDMDGAREVVDRVGGVYFDVKHPVRADFGRGALLLDQGYQLLDGEKFLTFVRDRSIGGDFGRASRQQEVLVEAFRQIKERGKLRDIPAMYRSVQNNVETNLNAAQIAQLALFGLRVKAEDISMDVFTGSGQYAPRNGLNISYVVINEQSRVELIKKVFGVDVPAREQITLPGPGMAPLPAGDEWEIDEYIPPLELDPGDDIDDKPGPVEDDPPETPGDDTDPDGDDDPDPDSETPAPPGEENDPPPDENDASEEEN